MKNDDKDGLVMPDLGDIPVPGSSFDIGNNSTTYKTAGQIPPPPPMPMMRPAMPPQMPPSASPAMMPHPGIAPSGAPQPPMPGMSDLLAQAQGAGSQLYGQYTPEKRNELYAMLAERANGMPNAIGNSLASVGDAIAHGYGHDQTNFLDKTLQGQKDIRQEAMGAFDTAQKGKLAETGAGMELEKMDPNSKISLVSRQAYAPLMAKLGYGPAALAKMSAANVETVAKVAADLGGKEMENLFHQAQLIVENNYHKAELGVREGEIKNTALKELASHPIGSLIPSATNQALKQTAGLTPGATSQGAAPTPMFAKNPETGHRIMSLDGGKSWKDAK